MHEQEIVYFLGIPKKILRNSGRIYDISHVESFPEMSWPSGTFYRTVVDSTSQWHTSVFAPPE